MIPLPKIKAFMQLKHHLVSGLQNSDSRCSFGHSKWQSLESGKVAIPKNAVVIDGKGKFVYPSFIDLYTNIGVEKAEAKQADPKHLYSEYRFCSSVQ